MKSLVLALIFFGVVVYGCYDVEPFRALRRAVRRTPRTQPSRRGTDHLEAPPPEAVGYESHARRHY